jgi:hypothetical protein
LQAGGCGFDPRRLHQYNDRQILTKVTFNPGVDIIKIDSGGKIASNGANALLITGGGINGSDTDLKGIDDQSRPFDGLPFDQRRRNTKSAGIQGNGTNNKLPGTFYGKWAIFKLAGWGTMGGPFVVGTMAVSGNANRTFDTRDKHVARPLQVFLVE